MLREHAAILESVLDAGIGCLNLLYDMIRNEFVILFTAIILSYL